MIDEVLMGITKAAMLTFVVAGMLSMGLRLTVASIIQPLRNVRLVVALLVANFAVVPAAVIMFARLLPMEQSTSSALILLGCCAGAPFLPTLAKLAKGDQALAVGCMVLLMVLTIAYAPLVVPHVIIGATVSAGDIASSLLILMVAPLAVGLIARARYPQLADTCAGPVEKASTFGLLLGLVAAMLVTWREVLGSLGSWIFIGTVMLLVIGLIAGYGTAFGTSTATRRVLALGTAQRNISAALVIAVSLDSEVLIRTLVAALVVPLLLILLSGELGRRKSQSVT